MTTLPVRLAMRELRGGLRGFYVFIACIALGVLAIAGVGSFAASLADGLARDGRIILGGDLSFTLSQREATQAERTFLESHGHVSAAATMRAMARTADGRTALAEIKAVDRDYPLQGTVALDPATEVNHAIGSKPALAMLPACFINPGDVTLMTVPGYPVAGTHTPRSRIGSPAGSDSAHAF